jgi:hypothetical protein
VALGRRRRRWTRTREQWIALVDGLGDSGLSQARYAQEKDVGVGALQYWISKLRKERAIEGLAVGPPSKLAFVEVLSDGSEKLPRDPGAVLCGAGFSLELERLPEPSWVASFVIEAARLSRC